MLLFRLPSSVVIRRQSALFSLMSLKQHLRLLMYDMPLLDSVALGVDRSCRWIVQSCEVSSFTLLYNSTAKSATQFHFA